MPRTQTFEHRGIALSPAPVLYSQAGAAVRGAEKRHLLSPSSAAALARGAAVCCAEVFEDFIGLAFHRGIGATRPAGGVCRSEVSP